MSANHSTILLVLVFNDGERVVREIAVPVLSTWKLTSANRTRQMHAFGAEFAQTAEFWATLVLVDGVDVYYYSTNSEAREILGVDA